MIGSKICQSNSTNTFCIQKISHSAQIRSQRLTAQLNPFCRAIRHRKKNLFVFFMNKHISRHKTKIKMSSITKETKG